MALPVRLEGLVDERDEGRVGPGAPSLDAFEDELSGERHLLGEGDALVDGEEYLVAPVVGDERDVALPPAELHLVLVGADVDEGADVREGGRLEIRDGLADFVEAPDYLADEFVAELVDVGDVLLGDEVAEGVAHVALGDWGVVLHFDVQLHVVIVVFVDKAEVTVA